LPLSVDNLAVTFDIFEPFVIIPKKTCCYNVPLEDVVELAGFIAVIVFPEPNESTFTVLLSPTTYNDGKKSII